MSLMGPLAMRMTAQGVLEREERKVTRMLLFSLRDHVCLSSEAMCFKESSDGKTNTLSMLTQRLAGWAA